MHLSVERVSLVYPTSRGPLTALQQLSFGVAPGEFVSVLGPSGCGKSTLLKLVTGLLRPAEGRLALAGRTIDGPRADVGIVFQQPTLLPWKRVIDNVLVPIRARGGSVAEHHDKAMSLLELVGLSAFARHYPQELSGGMQQRVGIARALLAEPNLLLMDEPFAALDAMTRESMMDELLHIWQRSGKTVLFITHSIPEAVYLSDRVLVMSPRPGRIVDSVRIDLPRPRSVETMAAARFGELCNELRARFRSLPTAPGEPGHA
ncbi:ABC transporter ATP-binding protein [Silanimonas sp.]|jgi:NitT/TauT family transport system ATP-binding protein|uniref:ABC transporter ATP-binding protein n=1 Tax=Silanimonas sp. TaxID=1929290 RepID=UPI0022BB1046|nr:ABC transporter ATP-binding protein [Silanimonas sp.]MCE2907733.1 ABC transporter ATP-binding protein [Burkholderiaceae bacterium]MCZ8167078.1 ABC transporter ATP-binding protein [Silanimonas sp.]